MCVADMTIQQLIDTALHHRLSAEDWRFEDECQRRLSPELFALPPPDLPVYVVAPLTPEQEKAAEANDLARGRIDLVIAAMKTHPAHRADGCGRMATPGRRHLDGGGVEDGFVHPPCGRNCCAYCVRERLIDTLNRAADVLLDAHSERLGGVGQVPRVEPLYVIEIPWSKWKALNRRIGRKVGSACGRLRTRRRDGLTLVIIDRPFEDARAVTAAEALDLHREYTAEMSLAKHSFQILGRWKHSKPKRWEILEIRSTPLDPDAVAKELAALGVQSRRVGHDGLVWRVDSEERANQLWETCRSLSKREHESSSKTNDDTRATDEGAIPDDDRTPSDPDPPDYDPGASPWG